MHTSDFIFQALNAHLESIAPGWNALSVVDPHKLILHSVLSALQAFDALFQKKLQTALYLFPTLCGISPRTAKLPWGYFSFPSDAPVTPGMLIFFHITASENPIDPFFLRLPPCLPSFSSVCFTQEKKNQSTCLSIQSSCSLEKIDIVYRHAPKELMPLSLQAFYIYIPLHGHQNKHERIEIPHHCLHFYFHHPLTWIEIHLKKIAVFLASESSFGYPTLEFYTLEMCWSHLLEGMFMHPPIACEIGVYKKNISLGFLEGLPWEEIDLPEGLMEIPQTLYVKTKDHQLLPFTQQTHARLQYAFTSLVDDFIFIYNSMEQTLIFPTAHLLFEKLSGGNEIVLPDAFFAPPESWPFPDVPFMSFSPLSFSITPHYCMAPLIPQETIEAYHTRFFELLLIKPFTSQCSTQTIASKLIHFFKLSNVVQVFIEDHHAFFLALIGPSFFLKQQSLSLVFLQDSLSQIFILDKPIRIEALAVKPCRINFCFYTFDAQHNSKLSSDVFLPFKGALQSIAQAYLFDLQCQQKPIHALIKDYQNYFTSFLLVSLFKKKAPQDTPCFDQYALHFTDLTTGLCLSFLSETHPPCWMDFTIHIDFYLKERQV